MSRQHAAPILVPATTGPSIALQPVDRSTSATGVTEAWIQMLVQNHPECLPISEIDPIFAGPVPICMELSTPAGPIDNFMLTPCGLELLVK